MIGGEGPIEARGFGGKVDTEMVIRAARNGSIVPLAGSANKKNRNARCEKGTDKFAMLLQ